jgi:hypothetical protein
MVTPLASFLNAEASRLPLDSSPPALSMMTPPPRPTAYEPPVSGYPSGTDWSASQQALQPGSQPGAQPGAMEGSLLPPSDAAMDHDGGAQVLPPFSRQYPPNSGIPTAIISLPRRRGPWRAIVVLLLVGLSAGAAVVHYKVVPLDVAAVWLKPAWLSVNSDPSGANVTLDGRAIPDPTPTRVEVKRDRAEHVLEVTRAGSLPVRTTVRFDRAVALSETVVLPPAPPPPEPPAPPVEAKPAVPEPPVAAATGQTHPTAKARKKPGRHESKQITKKKAKKKKGKRLH